MNAAVIEMTPLTLQRAGVVAEGNQHLDSTAILIGVEDVLVADRYRKDLGDVFDLKKSIVEIGLLNPITVREWHGSYRLVAGERRLTSFKELGLAEIPARVARDIADARDALVAERDENTARKEMLPSEKVALGMAIEEMEKPAALARQSPGINQYTVEGPGTRERKQDMRPRDIAAEAIDMGEATYRRIKTVVNLASDSDQTEEVREAARAAIEIIDAGGSARGEYNRVKEMRHKSESTPPDPPSSTDLNTEGKSDLEAWHHSLANKHATSKHAFEAEGHERYSSLESFKKAGSYYRAKYRFTEITYGKHARTSQGWLENASESIEVSLDVFSNIDWDTITPEHASEALQRINASEFNFFIKTLKGIANG